MHDFGFTYGVHICEISFRFCSHLCHKIDWINYPRFFSFSIGRRQQEGHERHYEKQLRQPNYYFYRTSIVKGILLYYIYVVVYIIYSKELFKYEGCSSAS